GARSSGLARWPRATRTCRRTPSSPACPRGCCATERHARNVGQRTRGTYDRSALRIEVGILGPFRVLVDGEERTLPARKQRVLVALLAIHGHRSRADLIAQLWPDADEDRGRESMRHALHGIRATIGAEVFAARADALAFGDAVSVDSRARGSIHRRPRPHARARAGPLSR